MADPWLHSCHSGERAHRPGGCLSAVCGWFTRRSSDLTHSCLLRFEPHWVAPSFWRVHLLKGTVKGYGLNPTNLKKTLFLTKTLWDTANYEAVCTLAKVDQFPYVHCMLPLLKQKTTDAGFKLVFTILCSIKYHVHFIGLSITMFIMMESADFSRQSLRLFSVY